MAADSVSGDPKKPRSKPTATRKTKAAKGATKALKEKPAARSAARSAARPAATDAAPKPAKAKARPRQSGAKDPATGTGADTDLGADGRFIRSKGMRFPNDPAILPRRRRRLLRLGAYEEKEFLAMMANLQPDDVVMELGAGMGFMSTAAAVKRNVPVHAFEANPAMISYIKEVHRLNAVQGVTVYNAILGDKAGTAEFYVRKDFTGSSLTRDTGGGEDDIVSVETIEVMDINKAFADIKPTFLICDIEGAEADLIPKADLSTVRCAVIELHPQWIGEAGTKAVFDAMAAAGLTFFPRTSNKKVATFKKDW